MIKVIIENLINVRNGFCVYLINSLIFSSSPLWALDIHVPGDYETIAEALSAASPSDRVMIAAGRYKENLVIKKTLSLIAMDDPAGACVEAERSGESVITVTGAEGVRIEGLTVTGSDRAGIWVHDSARIEIKNNSLIKNGIGLMVEKTRESLISGNRATDNARGIYLNSSHKNRLEKNAADSNSDKGIVLYASGENLLSGNHAGSNEWNGITIIYSNNNRFLENRVVRNTYAIVESGSSGNEFADNVTMGRLHLILPVLLVYLGITVYIVERRLFIRYYEKKERNVRT